MNCSCSCNVQLKHNLAAMRMALERVHCCHGLGHVLLKLAPGIPVLERAESPLPTRAGSALLTSVSKPVHGMLLSRIAAILHLGGAGFAGKVVHCKWQGG